MPLSQRPQQGLAKFVSYRLYYNVIAYINRFNGRPGLAKRIIFPEKGRVLLEEFELPEPCAGEVRVSTLYSLMSIGTETTILHQRYAPGTHFDRMFSFPQIKTGVQAVGEVIQLGEQVADLEQGDQVFMRMAHGSEQLQPAERCTRIPGGVDLKSACWCGLAKTAFRAAWAGGFSMGGHVLIIGAGPVGQMVVRWAGVAGVESIVVVDHSGNRLEHAAAGGATDTLQGSLERLMPMIEKMNHGRGPSLVIDSTGNPDVFAQALAVTAPFGKLILLGDTGFPGSQSLTSDMMTKGLTIQATHDSHDRDGWTQERIDRLFFRHVSNGRFDLSGLITHEFSPEECQSAYELVEHNRDQVMGVLFDWTANPPSGAESSVK